MTTQQTPPDLLQVPDDLLDALAGAEPKWAEPPEPPDHADAAERLMRRLAAIEAERQEVQALWSAELDRLNAWRRDRMGTLSAKANWLEDALKGWHAATLRDDPKRKTIYLPSGKLSARSGSWRVEIEDEAEFVRWSSNHGDGIGLRFKPPTIDREALRKMPDKDGLVIDTETGEPIPGVRKVLGEPSYTVKPGTTTPDAPDEAESDE